VGFRKTEDGDPDINRDGRCFSEIHDTVGETAVGAQVDGKPRIRRMGNKILHPGYEKGLSAEDVYLTNAMFCRRVDQAEGFMLAHVSAKGRARNIIVETEDAFLIASQCRVQLYEQREIHRAISFIIMDPGNSFGCDETIQVRGRAD